MPTATDLTIDAKDAKVGDHIPAGDIASVTVKAKWTTLLTAAGRTLRVENTQPITVTRQVPTDDEVAAKRAEDEARHLASLTADVSRTIANSAQRVEAAAAKIATGATSRIDFQWSCIDAYLRAVAERDIWATVHSHVGHTFEVDGEPYTVTLADSVEVEAQEIEHNLLNDYWRGNSSSGASNLASDVRRAVSCDWLRSYQVVGMRRFANKDKVGRNR